MVRPAIRVEGLRELRRAFKEAGDKESLAALKRAHKEAAEAVVKRALPNVPVLTGRLQTSVRALGAPSGGRAKAGGARVPYGPPIHWGWPARNIERRPFLWNALQELRGETGDMFLEALEAELRPLQWGR
ncbi:MAG: HK97 gp10 family phage protein [Actinomycetota bacterium]|nr:HK97 gp10 family phage protein [Actinomycetota bacterium]